MRRKVLLLEPNYNNKYPPMGLMKIATYYRNRGDDVRFYKGKLKDLCVKVLFEEFFQEVVHSLEEENNNKERIVRAQNDLAKYELKYIEYISTGKHAPLNAIPNLSKERRELITVYRTRYRKEDYSKFDIVCITTLFTFYWKKTIETINFAKKICKTQRGIKVGGIAASLIPDKMFEATGIKPFVGQLQKPEDLGDKNRKCDNYIIDELPLDYSILEEIDYKYPANNAYFAYMTRGCVNKCEFCAVPKLEPKYCEYINLKSQLEKTDRRFGAKRDLLLLDNNAFASECFDKIIDEIKECGFEKGATYIPPNEYDIAINNIKEDYNFRAYAKKLISIYNEIESRLSEEESGNFYNTRESMGLIYELTATKEAIIEFDAIIKPLYDQFSKRLRRKRSIDFNQGMDARLATPEKMKKLSEVNIKPLRIAFDHYSQEKTYKKAIRLATKNGIKDLSNYLLYNFKDKPEELYYRIKINVELCAELDVRIYSFPMKYHPIDDPDYFDNRNFMGKNWSRKHIRAIQAILNSTKGKIGKGQQFFNAAFGKDINEFNEILEMPEALIIHRYKYDKNKREEYGKEYKDATKEDDKVTDEWREKYASLNEIQLEVAKSIISRNVFTDDVCITGDKAVDDLLKYYQVKKESH